MQVVGCVCSLQGRKSKSLASPITTFGEPLVIVRDEKN